MNRLRALKKIEVNRFWLMLTFSFAIFFPTFYQFIGSAGAILVNGGLILLICIYLFKTPKLEIKYNNDRWVLIFFSAIQAIYLLLIIISISRAALNQTLVFRDVYEIHRPILYMLVIFLGFKIFKSDKDILFFERLFIWSCIFCTILAALQVFKIMPEIFALYTKKGNLASLRSSAPFVNPYDLGFFFSAGSIFLLSSFLFKKSFFYLVLASMCLLGALTTQSRAIIGALAVSYLLGFPILMIWLTRKKLYSLKIPRSLNGIWLMIGGLITLGLIVYFQFRTAFSYLILGFEKMTRGDRMRSLDERQRQLSVAFDSANESLWIAFFGNGPSKGSMEFVESAYTYFIFRYGLIGFLFVFLLPITITLLVALRRLDQNKAANPPTKCFYAGIVIFMVFTIIASLGNNFTEQIRLSFFFYLLMISFFRLEPNNKNFTS